MEKSQNGQATVLSEHPLQEFQKDSFPQRILLKAVFDYRLDTMRTCSQRRMNISLPLVPSPQPLTPIFKLGRGLAAHKWDYFNIMSVMLAALEKKRRGSTAQRTQIHTARVITIEASLAESIKIARAELVAAGELL